MTYIPRLAVAPGTGRIARRECAVLYLPEATSTDVVERFTRSEHDALADVLTRLVADDPDAAPAFVFIEWPDVLGETHIRVIVRGDVPVVSDLDAMPSLSGVDSATWVEHHVARSPNAARFECGAPAEADTDLREGLVGGGGFELQLELPTPTRRRAAAGASPSADRDRRLDRIASLEAAGGGDWMEESLQLGEVPPSASRDRPAMASGEPRRAMGPADDEPKRHEQTLLESAIGSESDSPTEIAARRVLLEVELPDGTRHRIGGTVVLGRQPNGKDAGAPDAVVIGLDAAPTVSRTHLRLGLDGRQLFATDCASSGGTVLIPTGDRTPVRLEPWMPHEVNDGDRLHLGGTDTILAIRSN